MSQEGTIQVKFAECTCFVGFNQYKYDGGGIPILNMSRDIIMNKWDFDGKNINKNWTKRNVNGEYVDAIKDKYVYVFSKSESGTKIEEELKCIESNGSIQYKIFELNKKDKVRSQRSDSDRLDDKGKSEIKDRVTLSLKDVDATGKKAGYKKMFFCLSSFPLSKKRILQIEKEIEKGKCNRAIYIPWLTGDGMPSACGFYTSKDSYDYNTGTIILIDFFGQTRYLCNTIIENRNKLSELIKISAPTPETYAERTAKRLIYDVIMSKKKLFDFEKYNRYKSAIDTQKFKEMEDTFSREDKCSGKIEYCEEQLPIWLDSKAFNSALNDFCYYDDEKYADLLLNFYADVVHQLSSSPSGKTFLKNDYKNSSDELKKSFEEYENTSACIDKVLIVISSKKIIDGFYSIFTDYTIANLDDIVKSMDASSDAIRCKKYAKIKEVLRKNKSGRTQNESIIKLYEEALSKIKKQVDVNKYLAHSGRISRRKYDDLIKDLKADSVRMGKIADRVMAGRIVLHSLFLINVVYTLRSEGDRDDLTTHDKMVQASALCDVVSPAINVFERILIKEKTVIFKNIMRNAAIGIGWVGGIIDAVDAFQCSMDASNNRYNENLANAYMTQMVGNIFLVAGSVALTFAKTKVGFELVGAGVAVASGLGIALIIVGIIAIIGGLIWASMAEDKDEIIIWLLHTKYGICSACTSTRCYSSPLPTLIQGYCYSDEKNFRWTNLEVKFERDNSPHNNYKPLLFPATAGSMINQRKFQDQKVYSHRWPKLPNEHVESFILLTQGQSF